MSSSVSPTRPRAIVKLNGERLRAYESARVTLVARAEADTFDVAIANDQAKFTKEFYDRTEGKRPEVEIWIGCAKTEDYGESDLVKMMYGVVDDVSFTFEAGGEMIHLTGRDMSAYLLDTRLSSKFSKRPAASHVRTMVEAHGLKLTIKGSPAAMPAFVEDGATEWDVVETMARKMNGVAFARPGTKEIYVGPREAKEMLPPIVFRENAQRLTIAKNLTVKYAVEVRSWDVARKQSVVGKYPEKPADDAQKRLYKIPEVRTSAEAKNRAQAIYEELMRGGVEIEATIAGNELYMPERQAIVEYVGDPDPLGPFARAYYLDEATHTVDKGGGYITDLKFVLPVEEFRAEEEK